MCLAVRRGRRDYGSENVPIPEVAAGAILVRVECAAIPVRFDCATAHAEKEFVRIERLPVRCQVAPAIAGNYPHQGD